MPATTNQSSLPLCGRGFHAFAKLDGRLAGHDGPEALLVVRRDHPRPTITAAAKPEKAGLTEFTNQPMGPQSARGG
jgi:hypothetical protein